MSDQPLPARSKHSEILCLVISAASSEGEEESFWKPGGSPWPGGISGPPRTLIRQQRGGEESLFVNQECVLLLVPERALNPPVALELSPVTHPHSPCLAYAVCGTP